jgi:hypothetical protein
MKKHVLLILLGCTPVLNFAQNFVGESHLMADKPGYDTITGKRKMVVALHGNLLYGSDGLNNSFVSNIYRGGYLDSAYVAETANGLLPYNRAGAHYDAGISFGISLKDTSESMVMFSIRRRYNLSAVFSDDAFRLGFQGNTQFKGEEADFSRSGFRSVSWTQLQLGYYTRETSNTYIHVGVSGIAGHQYNEAWIEYGKLFTDSYGTSLTGGAGADFYSSDTSAQNAWDVNGVGLSVDVSWMKMRALKNGTEYFRIECQDFGFINWNNKTIHRKVDTTLYYQGIDISELVVNPQINAALPEEDDFVKTDSAAAFVSTYLPAVLRVSYTRTIGIKHAVKLSGSMPFWSYALPYGSLTYRYASPKYGYMISGGVAYGGYAKLQVPLRVLKTFGPHIMAEAGAINVLSALSPDNFTGNGYYFKLSYTL